MSGREGIGERSVAETRSFTGGWRRGRLVVGGLEVVGPAVLQYSSLLDS